MVAEEEEREERWMFVGEGGGCVSPKEGWREGGREKVRERGSE